LGVPGGTMPSGCREETMLKHQPIFAAVLCALALASSTSGRVSLIAAESKVDTRVAEAAMRDDATTVTTLLQQRADVNGAQGDGMTALHWAAERGDGALASTLLKAGASPSALTRVGQYTPLHIAAKGGHAQVVQALVAAGADVRALTTTGAAPLHFAAASGSAEAVTVLLDRGADVNVREPQWGQTPLMFAAALGRTAVVKTLITRGADVRATASVV